MKRIATSLLIFILAFPLMGKFLTEDSSDPYNWTWATPTVDGIRYYLIDWNKESVERRKEFWSRNTYSWADVIPNDSMAPTYKTLIIPDSFYYNGYKYRPTTLHAMPHAKRVDGKMVFSTNDYLEIVKMNNYITYIQNYCFYGCVKLREIELKNVNHIGEMAFGNCPELSIRLPRSITNHQEKCILFNHNHGWIANLGDTIRKLEVVWDVPPQSKDDDGNARPIFQYVDTLVVPKGCLSNYAEWPGTKYGVIMEGDYEAEGNYPWHESMPSKEGDFISDNIRYHFSFRGVEVIPDKYEVLLESNNEPISNSYSLNSAATYRDLIIPDSVFFVEGYLKIDIIQRIGHYVRLPDRSSSDNTYLETVKIGKNIRAIVDSCFYRCVNLRDVSFEWNSDSYHYLGEMSFGRCPNLKKIRLPRFCYSKRYWTDEVIDKKHVENMFIGCLGDSIQRLELVWNEPPSWQDSFVQQLEESGELKPLFQYVDTLVVPKGCLNNYTNWTDQKYGIVIEGDYEPEGNYPDRYEWFCKLYQYNYEEITVGIEEVSHYAPQTVESNQHIYDLQGRRLSSKPKKGIYIENGRKRVVQ